MSTPTVVLKASWLRMAPQMSSTSTASIGKARSSPARLGRSLLGVVGLLARQVVQQAGAVGAADAELQRRGRLDGARLDVHQGPGVERDLERVRHSVTEIVLQAGRHPVANAPHEGVALQEGLRGRDRIGFPAVEGRGGVPRDYPAGPLAPAHVDGERVGHRLIGERV